MVCPFIAKCSAKVDIDKYTRMCASVREEAYKDCDVYQKLTREPKTPMEWSGLFGRL